MNRAILIAAVGIAAAAPQYADDVRHLTLTEAVHLAIGQNRALKIARLPLPAAERLRIFVVEKHKATVATMMMPSSRRKRFWLRSRDGASSPA